MDAATGAEGELAILNLNVRYWHKAEIKKIYG